MITSLFSQPCEETKRRLTLPESCHPSLSRLGPPRRRAARRWHAEGERTAPRWYSAAVRLRWPGRERWSHSRTLTWRCALFAAPTLPWWCCGPPCSRADRAPDRFGMPKSTGNRRLLHPPSYPQAPAPLFFLLGVFQQIQNNTRSLSLGGSIHRLALLLLPAPL